MLSYTTKNVILYNNPSKTGFNLSEESFKELLIQNYPQLIGLKEEYNVGRHKNTSLPNDFILFAGGDIDLTNKILNGCNGLSSMVGNVYPNEIKQAFNALIEKNPVDLHTLHQLITEVTQDQTIMTIKKHYNSIGVPVGPCRAPIQ